MKHMGPLKTQVQAKPQEKIAIKFLHLGIILSQIKKVCSVLFIQTTCKLPVSSSPSMQLNSLLTNCNN